MPGSGRAEFDRRNTDPDKRNGIRGSVAADRYRRTFVIGLGRLDQGRHPGRVDPAVDGRNRKDGLDSCRAEPADLTQDGLGILVWQVTDVDVDCAIVGDLVQSIATPDPAKID